MSDERARFEVLLEEVRSQFGVLADGHLSLRQSIEVLSNKIDGVAEELTEFRVTTNGRLTRIEHHVGLNGAPRPVAPTPSKRRKPTRKKSK